MTYHPIDLMRLITRQQVCLSEIGNLMSDRHDSQEIAPLLRLISDGADDLAYVQSEACAKDCAENDQALAREALPAAPGSFPSNSQ